MESNSYCLYCGASSKQFCSCNLSFSNDLETSTIQNTRLRNPPQTIEIKRRNYALDGIQLELFDFREKVQATVDSYEDIHRMLMNEYL